MIDLSKVTKVYSGKAGKCCCGCSGKYSETPRQIKRVAKVIAEAPVEARIEDNSFISADVGGRTYTVYFD